MVRGPERVVPHTGTETRNNKSVVKSCSLTVELPLILLFLNIVEVGGMCNVAVKCIDITQNTDCVGSLLSYY